MINYVQASSGSTGIKMYMTNCDQRKGTTSGLLALLRAEEAGRRTLTRARRTLTRVLSRHSGASKIFLRCPHGFSSLRGDYYVILKSSILADISKISRTRHCAGRALSLGFDGLSLGFDALIPLPLRRRGALM